MKSSSSSLAIISRSEAKARGLVRYFTGNPCKHGHTVERMVVNSDCVTCKDLRFLRIQKANRALFTKRQREWREANREKHNATVSRRYAANPEKIKAGLRRWREANLEKAREIKRGWKRRNPEWVTANAGFRRAAQLRALPKWIDQNEIKAVYKSCRAMGPGYHVDHIIPLINPKVCGLHVPWNLQIITAPENYSKNNKFNSSAASYTLEILRPPGHLG
jgi:hypothetical protein